jgi:hypothetical protein
MRWGLFDRPRSKSEATPRRTFRPMLEALETRDCPSLAITNFSANPTNAPGSRQVELKGTVSGGVIQQETVAFTGEVAATVGVDSSGNFDYIGSAGGLGTVTAVASGMSNYTHVTSAPATALITSTAPVITSFYVSAAGAGTWTFYGHVSDPSPSGIFVQFGGAYQVAGLYAITDASGNFSATFFIPNLANTDVSASCQDVWGLLSNTVWDPIV